MLLRDPRLSAAVDRLGAALVKAAVRQAQERSRAGSIPPDQVAQTALALLPGTASGLHPVINATGVLLHTNLGRAPLSTAARQAVQEAAGPTDVELDLTTGVRARRGRSVLAALHERVPAAGAAHVVNNGAAALVLAATALAAGKEIVVSRGEMVEIGDGFRLPDLLVSTGARLREVGTTNRTAPADYADAIGPDTGFVLKVHPSNFRITGFTRSVGVADLAGLGVPVVVDIGSGLLAPHPDLPEEPDAQTSLRVGAALVTASGDKLLGGPQCGLLLGREDLVRALARHPLARALRVDKLTLAALEATLTGPPTPTQLALTEDPARLGARAGRLAAELAADGIDVRAVESTATVGGGGAPGVTLPSAALSLPEPYAAALRTGRLPVVGRLEAGRCLLDLRSVPAIDDDRLAEAVRSAAMTTADRPLNTARPTAEARPTTEALPAAAPPAAEPAVEAPPAEGTRPATEARETTEVLPAAGAGRAAHVPPATEARESTEVLPAAGAGRAAHGPPATGARGSTEVLPAAGAGRAAHGPPATGARESTEVLPAAEAGRAAHASPATEARRAAAARSATEARPPAESGRAPRAPVERRV